MLIHDGYIYTRIRDNINSITWRCNQKNRSCNITIKTTTDNRRGKFGIVDINNYHIIFKVYKSLNAPSIFQVQLLVMHLNTSMILYQGALKLRKSWQK